MTLKVITYPNEILREVSHEITVEETKSPQMQAFFNDLAQTMVKEDGVGIAAPQVGKNIRVIAVNTKSGPEIFINPKITFRSSTKIKGEEGCLSVPGVYGIVERYKKINVSALNKHGEEIIPDTDGFLSIVFQHEIDHLDGILFIDRAKKIKHQRTSRI